MKTLLLSLLLSASCMLFATNTAKYETPTIYEQLCQLNKHWQSQVDLKKTLQEKVQFTDHEDLIQLHLQLVEQVLQQKNTNHLSALQKQNRKEALQVLKEYTVQKQFPKNTRHTSVTPYFIDDFNTACAVGHLMRESGAVKQAHWIAQTMNNAYIEDMPVEELQQWADKTGFEIEELKWIQPGYGIYAWETVENADCHTDNGSIFMSINGTSECTESEDTYAWYDYTDGIVKRIGHNKDLENAPSGFYRFQINMHLIGSYINCKPMRFIAINDAEGPNIEAEIKHPNVGLENGSIELSLTNGTPPYNIEWYDFNHKYLGSNLKIENLKGYDYLFMSQEPDFTHRVKITDANGCQSFQNFYLEGGTEGSPRPKFVPFIKNTIKNQSTGQIHIEDYYNSLNYQWSHDSNLTTKEANNLSRGNYALTVTDPETQEIFVRQFSILEEELTNIADRLIGSLKIYPTLASQNVRIDLPSKSEKYAIEVFDNAGQKMTNKATSINELSYSLEVNDYPKGIYFVSMNSEQGKFVGRFVKQ